MKTRKHSRWTRREFIRNSTVTAAAGPAAAGAVLEARSWSPSTIQVGNPQGQSAVRIEGEGLIAETARLRAVFRKGALLSLRDKKTGEEYLTEQRAGGVAPLSLVYASGDAGRLAESRYGKFTLRQHSRLQAEFIIESWDGDGILRVSVDPRNDDLVVIPSAHSSRPGLRACRWPVAGLREDLQCVAPFFQGVKLPLNDPLLRDTHWRWPVSWEAGLVILQGKSGGFWLHSDDTSYRYKSLHVGSPENAFQLGLETENYGPLSERLAAGGLGWRFNVFDGDWTVPAGRYREWMWKAWGLAQRESERAPWIREVALALCWCPSDTGILDALAARVAPSKILIHFPGWRSDPYDENYPTFEPSAEGKVFIEKARAMGFRIMPHFNSIDMDPSHPVYTRVRDFQYRDLEKQTLLGWSWLEGKVLGVPESNAVRLQHRDKKVMVKIHPGLSSWRSILAASMSKAVRELSLETVFIDVTLNTYNLDNCLVENLTPTEGMQRLIDDVGALESGLVVGGEGLNETTAQGLSFAQAHLFKSWHSSTEGLERTGGCPLNEFLFGRLCRTIGYSGLSGKTPEEEVRMRVHEEHGAIPTLTVRSPEEISRPNRVVQRILDAAASG